MHNLDSLEEVKEWDLTKNILKLIIHLMYLHDVDISNICCETLKIECFDLITLHFVDVFKDFIKV